MTKLKFDELGVKHMETMAGRIRRKLEGVSDSFDAMAKDSAA